MTEVPTCPECEHPLDHHGYSGCMDSDNPGERDRFGFCVCMKTLAELLPTAFAAVRAEADTVGFRRGVEKLDNLRRRQADQAEALAEVERRVRALATTGDPVTHEAVRQVVLSIVREVAGAPYCSPERRADGWHCPAPCGDAGCA